MAKTGAAKAKSDQLDEVIRKHRGGVLIEEIGHSVRLAILVGGACFFVYCVHLMVADLAGKITDANIALKFLGSLEYSVGFAWAAGLGGAAYGMAQNRLRRRDVRRLHGRVAELETIIDPKRSTSTLSLDGDTNPKDE